MLKTPGWSRALHAPVALCALLLGASSARAQDATIDAATATSTATSTPIRTAGSPRRLRLVAVAGWDYGFDEFFTARYVDGTTARLAANGGVNVALGAGLRLDRAGAFDLRATAGFKLATLSASNGSADDLAFPVELTAGWTVRRVRLSAGGSLSVAPRVRGDGVLADMRADLEDSLGLVVQVEWTAPLRYAEGSGFLGARFLAQQLELATGGGAHDANAVGLVVGLEL